MQLIIWQDTDSVGVKELDNQHKEIFSIINRLFNLINQSKIKQDFNSILNELVKSVSHHFNTEEKYFDLYQYNQKISHTKLHQDHIQEINQFLDEFNQNFSMDLIVNMSNSLKKWWIDHINNEDKKYSQYFNQQGLY